MKKLVIFTAISAIMLSFIGCPEPTDQERPEPLIYRVSLDIEEILLFHVFDRTATPHRVQLTLTNTGNQRVGDMVLGFTDNRDDFGLDTNSILGLDPGESETITITFPFRDQAMLYETQLLIGNRDAGARVDIRYGIFNLIPDPLLIVDPPLLQVGESDYLTFHSTDPEAAGAIWVYEAGFMEEGTNTMPLPSEAGEVVIGFLISEMPFLEVKGRRIPVHAAVQPMDVLYTVGGAQLVRNDRGTASPINLTEIRNYMPPDSTLNFRIENDGGGIISAIHPTFGEITLQGEDGATGAATIITEIRRTVPEGTLTVLRGISNFTARIGIAPAPILASAETINSALALQADRIDLNFDQSINAGVNDPRDGFTITRALAGMPSTALDIQSARIVGSVIEFTLNPASQVALGDVLTLAYNSALGGIQNEGNTALADITGFEIVNNLQVQEPGPAMITAVIDGSNRAMANMLTISYDMPALITNALGFSIANTTGGTISFTDVSADAEGQTITLTMNRLPMWAEVEANNLTLTYNAAVGTVRDEDNRPGVSGTIDIVLQFFSEDEYAPPVVESVTLDGADPTALVIEWDKVIAANAGFGGFTMIGATPAITFTGSSVSGEMQTLTMNRAPSPGELANLRLNYDSFVGNVVDTSSNMAESFNNQVITVTNPEMFGYPPVVETAVINADNPTLLVVTFDDPVAITSSTGFSITGSQTATTFIPTVSGSETTAITFTLNRKPAFGETLQLHYTGAGNAVSYDNPSLVVAGFANQAVTLNGFTAEGDSRPEIVSIIIDANRDGTGASFEQASFVYLTFNRPVNVLNQNGFGITGSVSATMVTGVSESGTETLVLALDGAASESEIANVRLTYNMDLGNVADVNNNVALTFNQNIQFLNYAGMGEYADEIAPWLVNAIVNHATPSIVQVVFSEPVNIDRTRFVVKVNTVPRGLPASGGAINGIPMDNGAIVRTITVASPVGTAPSDTWNLTMSSPAQFGDILRLATAIGTDGMWAREITQALHIAGAATDPAGNEMLAVTQFIIRNLIQRTRGAFELEPGLYRNGVLIPGVTDGAGGQMYQNALAHLTSTGNLIQDNEVITLVLPGNQVFNTTTGFNTFTSGHLPSGETRRNNHPTFIITTPTGYIEEITITVNGNGFGLIVRNALRLVIDGNIVFAHSRNVQNRHPLIAMMDGAKMILNGGSLRNNLLTVDGGWDGGGHRGGAVRVQGGSYGAYLVINSGDISGNEVFEAVGTGSTGTHGGGGAIMIMQYGAVIMHGGSIHNNLYTNNSDHQRVRAGAISDAGGTNSQHHANSAFFMTGGQISGNTVAGSSNGASSGGVLLSGVFQKNGGTIFGADVADAALRNQNLMTGTNNVRPHAIAVIMNAVLNPNLELTLPQARLRDTTAGPGVSLFVESSKSSNGAAGVNFVPEWALSFWDN